MEFDEAYKTWISESGEIGSHSLLAAFCAGWRMMGDEVIKLANVKTAGLRADLKDTVV